MSLTFVDSENLQKKVLFQKNQKNIKWKFQIEKIWKVWKQGEAEVVPSSSLVNLS